jgi:hypothetical protein
MSPVDEDDVDMLMSSAASLPVDEEITDFDNKERGFEEGVVFVIHLYLSSFLSPLIKLCVSLN